MKITIPYGYDEENPSGHVEIAVEKVNDLFCIHPMLEFMAGEFYSMSATAWTVTYMSNGLGVFYVRSKDAARIAAQELALIPGIDKLGSANKSERRAYAKENRKALFAVRNKAAGVKKAKKRFYDAHLETPDV